MGNRINTQKLFRQVHLYAAFFIMVFLLMYFVTGFLIVRHNWFDHDRVEDVMVEVPQINIPKDLEVEALAWFMKDKLELPGKLQRSQQWEDGTRHIEFGHPDAIYILTIDKNLSDYTLKKRKLNANGVLTLFHRMHGYGGGFVYDVLVFMMDLTSLSLIIFAITGVYLWLKVLKRKIWGFVFLALGLIYTIIVIVGFYYY